MAKKPLEIVSRSQKWIEKNLTTGKDTSPVSALVAKVEKALAERAALKAQVAKNRQEAKAFLLELKTALKASKAAAKAAAVVAPTTAEPAAPKAKKAPAKDPAKTE